MVEKHPYTPAELKMPLSVTTFLFGLIRLIGESKLYPWACTCCEQVSLRATENLNEEWDIENLEFDTEKFELKFDWSNSDKKSKSKSLRMGLDNVIYELKF